MNLSLPSLLYQVCFLFLPCFAGRFEGDQSDINPQLCYAVGHMVGSAFPTGCDEVADVDSAVHAAESVAQVLQDGSMLVGFKYLLWGCCYCE